MSRQSKAEHELFLLTKKKAEHELKKEGRKKEEEKQMSRTKKRRHGHYSFSDADGGT